MLISGDTFFWQQNIYNLEMNNHSILKMKRQTCAFVDSQLQLMKWFPVRENKHMAEDESQKENMGRKGS
jgi:hypothetical protein